jgi:hypothetical protein
LPTVKFLDQPGRCGETFRRIIKREALGPSMSFSVINSPIDAKILLRKRLHE